MAPMSRISLLYLKRAQEKHLHCSLGMPLIVLPHYRDFMSTRLFHR